MTAQIASASGVPSVDYLPPIGGVTFVASEPVLTVADFRSVLAPNTAAGVANDRNALRRCLITQARMLACWGPECFPSASGEQIHFARALMEAAAQEMSEAAGVPYPVPAGEPASNPIAGVLSFLARVEHTLNTLNGVYARDTDRKGPLTEWQVDVTAELIEVDRLLSTLRGMRV